MQRVTGQIHPLLPAKVFRAGAHVTDDFLSSKRDKRLVRHSSFVSRITSSRVAKTKRRRPQNKLKTSLDDLADALPELASGEGGEEALAGKIKHKSLRSKKGALKRKEKVVRGEMERFGVSMARLTGLSGAATMASTNEAGPAPKPIVRQGSHDEGGHAMASTTEQSGAAAAGTAAGTAAGIAAGIAAPGGSSSSRWAALRGYISATMEQNPAFDSSSGGAGGSSRK
ncbi:hypothetical protein UVI_02025500 [Ustilaginoidea virens]|uniref:Ribosome biogenesis protein SLX9 n=1 Tax=Ustilaginoidea virens TaxID=1159556 RepID=A0A1B5KR54_USTVR|nr:hypothetical protein UVI_02025500 [Ustilaginoidea virens]